jgi:hypothetical protein
VLGAAAFLLSVALAAPLASWIIDDAGISFAYARSLATGHGLTAQPGVEPVEGFSNPLWTFLFVPWFAAGWFHVPAVPKVLSLVLVAATFALVLHEGLRSGRPAVLAAAPLLLAATNVSFVAWTTSGLENPLLVFLATLSAVTALRAGAPAGEAERRRQDAAAGAIAGLLALVRPDAIVYAAAYPLAVAAGGSRPSLRDAPRRLAAYALGLGPIVGSYLALRRLHFGDWVPNTYHAKDKPSAFSLLDFEKLGDLLDSVAGGAGIPLALLMVLAAGVLLAKRRLHGSALVPTVYLAVATAAYLVLPLDWMGEYRFATPFFLFFYWAAAEIAAAAVPKAGLPRWERAAGAAVAGLALASAFHFRPRFLAFASNPTVPFARVAAFSGNGYNEVAKLLGRRDASLLTADLGGTLFYSKLRVFDLAGLCDRTVARTLRRDRPAFLRYVFDEARPTFIHVHASWAQWASFHEDPRFARDYVPLSETWDWPAARPRPSRVPWAADYVRRDAVADAERLARLRTAFGALGLPSLSP